MATLRALFVKYHLQIYIAAWCKITDYPLSSTSFAVWRKLEVVFTSVYTASVFTVFQYQGNVAHSA